MEDCCIKLKDLFKYSFYDDSGHYTFVLDQEYIKEKLGVDILIFEEYGHT